MPKMNNRTSHNTIGIDILALKKSVSTDPCPVKKDIPESRLKLFFKPSEKTFVILHKENKYCIEVTREKLDYRENTKSELTTIIYTISTKRILINDVERGEEARKVFFFPSGQSGRRYSE